MKALLLALVLPIFVSVSTAAPPPVEAFGRKPAVIDVDINPSGTRLAWIEDDGKAAHIVIYDLAARKDMRKLNVAGGTRMRTVQWANDDTVLIDQTITHSVQSDGKNPYQFQRLTALDATGGPDRMMLMNDPDRKWVTAADLVRRRTNKPGKIYMSTLDFSETRYRSETGSRLTGGRKDDGWVSNLYEVDLVKGDGKVIANGSPFTSEWLADDSGEKILRTDFNSTTGNSGIYVRKGGGWKALYESKDCGAMSLLGWNADNTAAIVRGRTCGDERTKAWSLPLDGSPMTVLVEDPVADAQGTIYDALDGRPLAISMSGSDSSLRWLDPQAERRYASLRKTFGTPDVYLLGRSADYKRIVVLAEKPRQAPVYFLVDYVAKSADIVNEAYPLLEGVTLGEVSKFEYKARDEYSLFGYLTRPPEAAEKNLPLVVLPHGGPQARDEPGFDWFAQFLASRGYAVFQPQFRGSSGLGHAHAEAGRHQWGLRMQDDVTDGVKALVQQGIADPKRICIVGASYGGYAALAGAAFTPDLYVCAASINGVTDLPAFIGYAQKQGGKESDSLAYWRDHIGSPNDPQVIAKSPARNARAIHIPILLLHGTDDTTVPIAQSQLMAKALSSYNNKPEFIELPGDDHFLSSSASRVRALTELEKFLAKYLAPAALAAN
jgi:dipeptidyl aminopeptidase/acylaminoacyl peptidase